MQKENVCSPIEVTLLGITIEVREVHLYNACPLIEVTLLGITTEVREVQ